MLSKRERSFCQWQFRLETCHTVRLASKIGEGGGFGINDRKSDFRKNDFGAILGKSEWCFRPWQFFLTMRHIVCLAQKIGEGGGFVKTDQKRVFRRNDFEAVLGISERSFHPWQFRLETHHIVHFCPENRWGGRFRKNRPETWFSEKRFRGRFRHKQAKFSYVTISLRNAPHSRLALKIGEGGSFVKTNWKRIFRKNNFWAVLGKSEQSFRPWQFFLTTHHSPLGPENRWGGQFRKNEP